MNVSSAPSELLPSAPSHRPRVDAVDLVRGVIMIIMALDHTRDFFGMPGAQPTNLAVATPALFATRWITNFCAPVFFLLTGTGARLSLRKQSPEALQRFLVTRGLWLMVAEVTLVRTVAYQFNVDYRVTLLLVLWALGLSMIVLAGLVKWQTRTIAIVGLVMIAAHNLLDGISLPTAWWALLHGPGFVLNTPRVAVLTTYPLIPWVGVTAVGYALGAVYEWDSARRVPFLWRSGVYATAAFVVLRAINVYGDPSRWQTQPTALFTALSFVNTSKYPPSLLFLLMTLGPALWLLALAERPVGGLLRPALTIGRVPFFYYVLHFAFIHLLAAAVCMVRYGSAHWMTESPDLAHYPFTAPPGWGYSLPVVYFIWVLVVVAMYPLCRWFAAVKQRRREAWLSYL